MKRSSSTTNTVGVTGYTLVLDGSSKPKVSLTEVLAKEVKKFIDADDMGNRFVAKVSELVTVILQRK